MKNENYLKTLENLFNELCLYLKLVVVENIESIKYGRLSSIVIVAWEVIFTTLHCFNYDLELFKKWGIAHIFFNEHVVFFYKMSMFVSGYFIYGLYRYGLLAQTRRAISDAFHNARLVTFLGNRPKFISITALTPGVYELRFFTNGVPFERFKTERATLEAHFFIIDSIEQDPTNPQIVVIRFASKPLKESISWASIPDTFSGGTLPLGQGRAKFVTTNFASTPHLLIGGTTGAGKSSFLRYLITYILTRMKDMDLWHVDLKEGSEAAPFLGAKNYRATKTPSDALAWLEELLTVVKTRMDFLSSHNLQSIDELKKMANSPDAGKIKWSEKIKSDSDFRRIVLVIDEAMSLFLTHSVGYSSKDAVQAKGLMQELGAKGRAAGVSIILATQRPDRYTIDMNIKTHMSGRIAFVMSDAASSMTILDNGDAAKLLKIPGRALWSAGLEQSEMQVPYVSGEEARDLLKAHGCFEKEEPQKEKSAGEEFDEQVAGLQPQDQLVDPALNSEGL